MPRRKKIVTKEPLPDETPPTEETVEVVTTDLAPPATPLSTLEPEQEKLEYLDLPHNYDYAFIETKFRPVYQKLIRRLKELGLV